MRVCIVLLSFVSMISARLHMLGPPSLLELFKDDKNNKNVKDKFQAMQKLNTIDVVYSNFGHIPYGQSMVGDLYFNNKNQLGCNKENVFFNESASKIEDSDHSNIDHQHEHVNKFVLLERGDCHFVTKVRNVALNGGQLAIIIDNKNEDINGVMMSDDGTGAGIRIPSILIGNADGQKLKKFIENNPEDAKKIKFNIWFNAPVKGNKVYVDLWYTQSDRKTMNFVVGLGALLKPIMNDIYIQPRYVTYASKDNTFTFKQENCLSDGKYCATSHFNSDNNKVQDHIIANPVTGRDILLENLYQCELATRLHPDKKYNFFKYLKFVNDLCGTRITEKCRNLGLKDIGYDSKELEANVNQTFEQHGDLDSINLIYQSQLTKRTKLGLHIYPAVVINEEIFKGQMNPDNVFEAICASFKDMPAGCYDWEQKVGIKQVEPGVTSKELLIIIGVLVTINICIALAYRSFLQGELKKDMKIQVSSAVSQYVALSNIPELNETQKIDQQD